jgi:hypothetical protein
MKSDWSESDKDLYSLTFLKSLMLFVGPSSGHFTLRLGCCLVFLVAPHLYDRRLLTFTGHLVFSQILLIRRFLVGKAQKFLYLKQTLILRLKKIL